MHVIERVCDYIAQNSESIYEEINKFASGIWHDLYSAATYSVESAKVWGATAYEKSYSAANCISSMFAAPKIALSTTRDIAQATIDLVPNF